MKLLVTTIILGFTATTQAAMWDVDSSHAVVGFSVKHLTISNVKGEFAKVSGTVDFDGKNTQGAKIDITIDASTVDTRDLKRDEHLKSADFLDVAKFPTITFKSKKIMLAKKGKFKATGDLTIRGVTKEVTLDISDLTAEVKDPWGNTRIGVNATTIINRKDFGASWNKVLDNGGLVVGDEVKVNLEIELIKKPS